MDRLRHAVAAAIGCLAGTAHAEHDHGAHGAPHTAIRRFEVGLGLIAATYDAPLFDGNYQGVRASGGWMHERVAVSASLPAYRIVRNGKLYRGFGDAMVHAQLRLFERGELSGGGIAMIMLPTGDAEKGLGMGHAMAIPSVWLAWTRRDLALTGEVGYARGLGDAGVHDEHAGGGAWPLVDPTSFSEVTFGARALVTLAEGLRAGGGGSIAVPTDDGNARVVGAVRVMWGAGRVTTTADIEAGFSCSSQDGCMHGEPFHIRGVLAGAVRF